MPSYQVTLTDGTSSEKPFESDFHAINETHRPHAPRRAIAQIDRFEPDGSLARVRPTSPIDPS